MVDSLPIPTFPKILFCVKPKWKLRNFLFEKPFLLPETSQVPEAATVKAEGTGNTWQLGP